MRANVILFIISDSDFRWSSYSSSVLLLYAKILTFATTCRQQARVMLTRYVTLKHFETKTGKYICCLEERSRFWTQISETWVTKPKYLVAVICSDFEDYSQIHVNRGDYCTLQWCYMSFIASKAAATWIFVQLWFKEKKGKTRETTKFRSVGPFVKVFHPRSQQCAKRFYVMTSSCACL